MQKYQYFNCLHILFEFGLFVIPLRILLFYKQ